MLSLKRNRFTFSSLMTISLLMVTVFGLSSTLSNHTQYSINRLSSRADQRIDPKHLDYLLLENTIIYYTNRARIRNNCPPCSLHSGVRTVARAHSREMAALNYFSHHSPKVRNLDLTTRMRNGKVDLNNTQIGENIAVDFFLEISNVPYYVTYRDGKRVYIEGDTGEVIRHQTYRGFAERTVKHWMQSQGHRKNIVTSGFRGIGIGVAPGKFNGLDAIYVTQNFIGPYHKSIPVNGVNHQ